MEKEKWQIETYWSFSTPLTIKLPSWKYIEIDLYLSEFILIIRMRGYMLQNPDYQFNSVMADNNEVAMAA